MIGVARLPVRDDHDARPQMPDLSRDGHARGDAVVQARVGKTEVAAPRHLENPRGLLGFRHADLRGTARSHVARGQIHDAGAIAHPGHFEQGSAARLLDIVRMRGDGQYVQRSHSQSQDR